MKGKLIFLLRYYLFWLFVAVVCKVIFLFYQWKSSANLSVYDILQVIVRGLQLDLSLGGYIMMLVSILMALLFFLDDMWLRRVVGCVTILCLVFYTTTAIIDLELFKNWGFHIDATPLMYLSTPSEMMASTPIWLIFCLLSLMIGVVMGMWWVFKRMVLPALRFSKRSYWSIPLFLIIGVAMILPIRGGLNVAPMNCSFVFFHSQNMYANQAAINPVWNFVYELLHLKKDGDIYAFMPEKEMRSIVDTLKAEGAYPRLLTTKRPNVVFILLESFSAQALEALGGMPDVTPQLNALIKEGVLFSNIYATGARSDRGMVAAISALPSNPSLALLKQPHKIMKYPSFSKDLEKVGYSTRYYYGGDINFGNFRSYVTMNFQEIVTEDNFSGEAIANRFKWGVHDEYMFDKLYEDLQQAKQPFMYMAFTMSSHEPFVVPGEVKFPGNDSESIYANAVHYSDACLGDFIRKCKAGGFWENTLFILMADHGTRHIGHLEPHQPEAYHIPLILTGGVIHVKDTIVSVLGSQTDMVATVLAQLELDHSSYRYSRNLLIDSIVPFAFYSYPNAAGVISEDGVTVMHLRNKEFFVGDSLRRNLRLLKAYLQEISTKL